MAQEAVEYLQLDLNYDTAKLAERTGLAFSKKGVDLKALIPAETVSGAGINRWFLQVLSNESRRTKTPETKRSPLGDLRNHAERRF